jgi:hypothetical protein
MIAYLQILIVVGVIVQLLSEDIPIPDDVVHEIITQTIAEHDVPPLTGKCQRYQRSSNYSPTKRTHINMTTSGLRKAFLLTGWVKSLAFQISSLSVTSELSIIW